MPHFLKDFDPDRLLKEQVEGLVKSHADIAAKLAAREQAEADAKAEAEKTTKKEPDAV
jgi:hypothetical protein